mgnify:CR=1 FL=1
MNYDESWAGGVADLLCNAQAERRAMPTLQDQGLCDAGAQLGHAYRVQAEGLRRRVARGDREVGHKVAITTRRKLAELGLDAPIFGRLLASGDIPHGGSVSASAFIAPRIEPEIAFVLGRELKGPGCTLTDVQQATAFVACAFEILDSRIQAGPFHVFSAVADNVSVARHVVGPRARRLDEVDLELAGCLLYLDDELVATGAGAQVLEHPALAVVELANELGRQGQALEAGSLVLTGGLIPAIPVRAGSRVRARVQGLGEVAVTFR